jgi:iron complex outermembrane recepter protein
MIKHAHVLGTASAAALVMAMGGMMPAQAQVAPRDNSSVETVTVTGSRIKEDIQTVSAAISALSGEQLQNKNVITVSDLQYATPSLSITDAGLSQNVNIRGIGLSSGSPAVSAGAPIYLDGLVQPPIAFANGFFDVQDVEVYRGPQGTFAGASSTGGAIFVNSNNPTFDKLSGSIAASGSNYWGAGLQGAVNVPLADDLAFRAAFNIERRDSFYENLGSAATPSGVTYNHPGRLSEQDVRLGFFWQPTEALSVLVKIAASDKSTDGYVMLMTPANANYALVPHGKRQISYDTPQQNDERTIRNSLDIKYVLPNGITLRSLTGYQENVVWNVYDTDGTSVPSLSSDYHQDVSERPFTQEFNIISPDNGRFKWILGAFYYYDMLKLGINMNFAPTFPGTYTTLFYTDKKTEAVFGRVQYNVTDALQIEVGGRYEKDWSTNIQYQHTVLQLVPPFPFISDTSDTNSWSGDMWTGKVAVNYTLDDQNFLYAFVSKGSKVGGSSTGYTFKPETVWDYEAGWKSTLFDGRLITQLAGFYSEYTNFQVDGINPVNGLNSTFNVTSPTTFEGLELQLIGNFGQFHFDAGGAFVQSSIGEVSLINTSLIPGYNAQTTYGPQCATGVPSNPPVCYDYGPARVSVKGRRNPYAPVWTFNFGVEYAFNIGTNTTLTPRVDYSYQGSQWSTLWENPADFTAAHDLWNLRLTLDHNDWSLSAYITNLLDNTYNTGGFLGYVFQGAPRQYGARLSYRF